MRLFEAPLSHSRISELFGSLSYKDLNASPYRFEEPSNPGSLPIPSLSCRTMLMLISFRLKAAMTKIERLEKEKKDREPLYEVGKNIRSRFLEQARETILCDDRRSLDVAIIEQGNVAAHSGNSAADAALVFQMPNLPNAHHKVFTELYIASPAEYTLGHTVSRNPKMREAVDLWATIRTVKSLNQGVDRPLKEKQSAMDAFEIITAKYLTAEMERRKLSNNEEMEVDKRLAVLKEFTKIIVEYDRRITGKEGGKKKISNTAY
jgi:hypothetical protein